MNSYESKSVDAIMAQPKSLLFRAVEVCTCGSAVRHFGIATANAIRPFAGTLPECVATVLAADIAILALIDAGLHPRQAATILSVHLVAGRQEQHDQRQF